MSNLVKASEAAKHFGVAESTIHQWARTYPQSRPARGRFDLEVLKAFQARKATLDYRTVRKLAATAEPRSAASMAGAFSSPASSAPDDVPVVRADAVEPLSGADIASQMMVLKLSKEKALTNRAQLIAKREAGELVALDDVTARYSAVVADVKLRLEALPGRLAPDLVGRNKSEVETILEREIGAALAQFQQDRRLVADAFA